MKNKLQASLLLGAIAIAPAAQATQFGAVLGIAVGDGYASFDDPNQNNITVDVDTEHSLLDIGFAMATGGRDEFMSYRLNLGLAIGSFDSDETGDTIYDSIALASAHSLAFRFVNTPKLSVWAGPSLYLGFGQIEYDGSGDTDSMLAYGVGPSVGLDLHLGENAPTLTFELAYRLMEQSFGEDVDVGSYESYPDDLQFRFGLLFGG